jgi:hypothetical protein
MFHVHIDVFKKIKRFMLRYLITALYCNFSMYNILCHTCICNSLPEDEPSDSEHIKDIIN